MQSWASPTPLPLLGLPGSVSLSIAEASGIPVVREGFADRAYTSGGRLVPATSPGPCSMTRTPSRHRPYA